MRTRPEVTLPISIDRARQQPLPVQVAEALRDLVTAAVLAPGDALPSSRALAEHLGVSRGTVVAAFDQLLAEGYLDAAAGRSTLVNQRLRPPPPVSSRRPRPVQDVPAPRHDLRPGRPWTGEVAGPAWKAAWRRAAASPPVLPVPVAGLPQVRTAWADHLRRSRAVLRDPAQIVVTAGGREGLGLVLHALAGQGPLRVGVEEPGYPSLRRVPARFGATLLPFDVDEHGLTITDLPSGAAAPDLLVVTPSHQYPLGGSLPIDRRQALLEWAHHHNVVLVEDDYDSELRYTSQPLPALAALDDPDDGCVVLLSTLSSILTPAVATGFLAIPTRLMPAVVAARRDLGGPVSVVGQAAVADYLTAGALRRHVHRMRQRYRRRRAMVSEALAGIEGIRVQPVDGGLHAVVETTRDEAALVVGLAERGVAVSPLSQYWSGPGTRTGIVLGFGAAEEADLAQALAIVAEVAG